MATIPLPYQVVYLYLEPAAALVGAYFSAFQPSTYLGFTHAPSAPDPSNLPLSTLIALRQLASLFVVLALVKGLVLRATSDIHVWRTVTAVLLVADLGYLLSLYPRGLSYYYDVASWDAAAWGNLAFAYFLVGLRLCFLFDVGFAVPKKVKAKVRKSIRVAGEELGVMTPTPPPKELGDVTPIPSSQLAKTPAQSTRRKKRGGSK